MESVGLIIGVVVALLAGLWLILYLGSAFVLGAGQTFAAAVQQGFIGVGVYILLWVFAAPLMLVVCTVVGAIAYHVERAEEKATGGIPTHPAPPPEDDDDEDDDSGRPRTMYAIGRSANASA